MAMEGKRHKLGSETDEERGGVEQYREFIVEGEIYQALDLGRRLLQLDGDYARRAEAALLLLDRLRSNRDDSADHANALLRVLANYATPTEELTEELLSLLFFCDHRVQIIHHLSMLTFHSKQCVRLVLNAYIELLSSDRALLVPILGSLADLPLAPADKASVIDATEGLLDAANEEDVPAVVESVLCMLVPAAAARVVAKIRSQCNRLKATSTLSLTFDVIMRHAVAGSTVLAAILRAIRNSAKLTPFDLIFTALLTARPSENASAVRVSASLASKSGGLNRQLVQETMQCLHSSKWSDAFPSFVLLSTSLLHACFNKFRTSATTASVRCAIDILGDLIIHRTSAQEEALSLLLSLASQPQRLVLSTSQKALQPMARVLCWDVARFVADKLAHIAVAHVSSLAPYAHIFLDHLYGIAASSGQSFTIECQAIVHSTYPAPILESLCHTMVTLVKYEHSMISLLMITIQKQLVVPLAMPTEGVIATRQSQASRAAQVKQLMAVFLAGEMLRQGVGEISDRSSLLGWIQKLLASAAVSDETSAHVVQLLAVSSIRSNQSTTEREASSILLKSVFRRHGFDIKEYRDVINELHSAPSSNAKVDILPGLSDQTNGWVTTSLVFDVVSYVRVARLGQPPFGWDTLVTHGPSDSALSSVKQSVRAKFALLRVDAEAFVRTVQNFAPSDARLARMLVCSFALPTVSEDTFALHVLPTALWSYTCALELAIITTNSLVMKQRESMSNAKPGSRSTSETTRHRKRLLHRVQLCWILHKRLRALLDESKTRLTQKLSGDDVGKQLGSSTWLQLQVDVIENRNESRANWFPDVRSARDLSGLGERLSLDVVSALFEGLWKQQSITVESGLEIELFRAFPAHLSGRDVEPAITQTREDYARDSPLATIEELVNTQDGKRTLKYISRRLLDYTEQLVSLNDAADGADTDDMPSKSSGRDWVLAGASTLCTGVRSIIDVCRKTHHSAKAAMTLTTDERWEETAMELLAKGAFDGRIRSPRNDHADMWSFHCEVMFQSLAQAALQATDHEIACELMTVLHLLTAHTRSAAQLNRLYLALLHNPYSSKPDSAGWSQKLVRNLPIVDAAAADSLTGHIRPQPKRFHHLIQFVVGSWAVSTASLSGLTHILYIIECMDDLISSSASELGTPARPHHQRSVKSGGQRPCGAQIEPDEEDEIDFVAHDGEHHVLKNLTNETLPLFLETVIACLAASLLHPSASTGRDHSGNPFTKLMGSIVALGKSLQLYVTAELSGFNFPSRTSTAVLRCGPIVAKNMEQAISACFARRQEDSTAIGAGKLDHLQALLEVAQSYLVIVEGTSSSFQDRVVLTVQHNAATGGSGRDESKDKKSKSARRWGNDLLSKAHGNQFQRRKALTRSEAKLLPYFTHSTEQLKTFLTETGGVYRFDLDEEHTKETTSNVLRAVRLGDADLEGVLALLEPGSHGVHIETIQSDRSLVAMWSLLTDEDDREGVVVELESGDDLSPDEDQLSNSDDELEDSRETNPSRKRSADVVHTLVPQKKRIKGLHP